MLPWLGRRVAGDEASYRYLAESIRRFPDQETLLGLMRDAGLEDCRYHNLAAASSRCTRASVLTMLLRRLQADVLNRNVAGSRRAQELDAPSRRPRARARLEGTATAFFFEVARRADRARTERRDARGRTLAGTPLALLSLAGPDAEGRLRSRRCASRATRRSRRRSGSSCEQTRPDLEEELAAVVGDVAARRVANLARGVLALGRSATDSLATSVAEYLQEEGRDVPARVEVEEFLRDVDQLRDDVERLEARLARLGAAPRDTDDTTAQLTCARVCSAACSPYSACWSGMGWTTSSSRRTCSGRCGSCSTCRPRHGSSARKAGRAASGSGSRSRNLGPIFVKFGQALSTRRDLLPADVADELAKLQDRVPPFPGAEARAIVERAYGRPVAEVFETLRRDTARGGVDRAGARGDVRRTAGKSSSRCCGPACARRSSAISR